MVTKLLAKHRHLSLQFVRYLGVAFVGLGFDFGVLVLLREVGQVHYLIAAAGGFTAGLIVNYLLSIKYVFTNPKIKSHAMNFGLFALIGLIGLGLLSLCMWTLTDGLGINYIASKVLATAVVYVWNFFARRHLYHDGAQPADTPANVA
jgi:putative flippase GtrA